MKPGIVYTIHFDTLSVPSSTGGADRVASQNIIVQIFDYGTMIPDDDIAQVIPLIPAMSPLEIEVVDNDETKFKPIRAKQATIRFISQQDIGLDFSLFARGYDNQFYVSIGTGSGQVLFLGYLMLPDGQMPFHPDPNVVELTASDHLPLLKDIALVDSSGDNIQGKYRIAELLCMALAKTGLSLPLNVINNLRMGTGSRQSSNVTFAAADNSITVDFYIGFFYVGQVIDVVSASNTGTYRVLSIDSSTKIIVDGTIVNETATIYNVQFTDVSSNGHFYDKAYLDAKTFEAEIGVSVNCYEAIERILRDDCTLFQYKGEWWIICVDEYDNNGLYRARFNTDGDLTQEPDLIDMNFSIGFNESVLFANANQIVRCDRPHKFVKEKFDYNNPLEIVCNIDFSRGESTTPVEPSNGDQSIDYSLECWEFLREGNPATIANLDQPPSSGSLGVLTKRYEFAYEKERYLRTKSASGFRHYFKAQELPVLAGDKLEVGVGFRLSTSETVTNINMVNVMLIGDDGNYYIWDYDEPTDTSEWVQHVATDAWFNESFRVDWSGQLTTDWKNVNATSLECPVSGLIIIRLVNNVTSSWELWFSGLTVTYIPKINGSFQRYTGHTNTVTRAEMGYAAKKENTVHVGDAPRPIIKGAIFFELSGKYYIAQIFYPSSHYGITGNPQPQMTRPYGWHQVFAIWNQYKSPYTIITGDVWGVPAEWPDLVHVFLLTDPSGLVSDRFFMLISFSQDWKTGIWRGTFVEVYNTVDGKDYSTPFEFKYIRDGNN